MTTYTLVQLKSYGIIPIGDTTPNYRPPHSHFIHRTDNYMDSIGGCNPSYAGDGKCFGLATLIVPPTVCFITYNSHNDITYHTIQYPVHCRTWLTADGEKTQKPVGRVRQLLLLPQHQLFTTLHRPARTTTPRTTPSTGQLLRATISLWTPSTSH
eukprot:4932162-Amphidinium_carterae.2